MKINQAKIIAIRIMNQHPELYLCGSVALILTENIPNREVNDLDFLCLIEEFDLKTFGKAIDTDYGVKEYNEGYKCYKVNVAANESYYYNIFVHEDSSKINLKMDMAIKMQCPDQILMYKAEYGRMKDLIDLGINPKRNFDFDDIPF